MLQKYKKGGCLTNRILKGVLGGYSLLYSGSAAGFAKARLSHGSDEALTRQIAVFGPWLGRV